MKWDPAQYARYADERGRPFDDLLRRVAITDPRHIVDLGCGPGNLTASLADRWPAAQITGIDSSPEMIETASRIGSNVDFEVGDVAAFRADGVDLIVSNACLQWLPEHRDLIALWSRSLPEGGVIAFQVPGNGAAPSHELMRELAASVRWSSRLRGVLRLPDMVSSPAEYARILLAEGLQADVWETTYVHVLTGDDPVLEWLRGTGLRPVLEVLSPADGAEFEAELAILLREAYPTRGDTTLLPFRRVFAVGQRA